MGYKGKMPRSGTCTSVGFNRFLLFKGARYCGDSKLVAKDFFP